MNELAAVNKAIRLLGTGDSALTAIVGTRIYDDDAPEGAALPYVVSQYMTSFVQQGVGTKVMQVEIVMLIKFVTEGSITAAGRTAIKRFKALYGELSNYAVTLDTAEVFTVHARPEASGGIHHLAEIDRLTMKRYTNRGGKFRFYVSQV